MVRFTPKPKVFCQRSHRRIRPWSSFLDHRGGTGDPIPFVNVVFKGTGTGATTDFDGNFLIRTNKLADSIVVSYIGYKVKTRIIKAGVKQTINLQLEEAVTNLQEVIVKAGENPAFEILRSIVRNKNKNDKRNLILDDPFGRLTKFQNVFGDSEFVAQLNHIDAGGNRFRQNFQHVVVIVHP